jgi:XcyI restriction endonuclease
MSNHVQTELASRYLARAGFFWRRIKDARFKDWQKTARNAAWENLEWDWKELGITDTAREAAKKLGFVPSEVFVHPHVILKKPELTDYYRLLACLPNKGLAQIKSKKSKIDSLTLCQLLNGFLSSLLTATAKASRESLLNTVFAEAGTEWQGTWVNSIGLQASQALEQILSDFASDRGLMDVSATAKFADKERGFVLKTGTIIRFGSEPDVECRSKTKELICVIEIKGSADKAGAQTRLGETKKSFTKAKLENPRCHTIFLPSVLTPAVEKQLKTERDIDQVFDLLAILRDESKRVEFLEELFKFRLREKI